MNSFSKSPKKKAAAMIAAISALLAFGGALAYLTDHDALANQVSFLKADTSGLISLAEPGWTSEGGKDEDLGLSWEAYAKQGILPGETLTKDPTITVNNWLKSGDAASTNSPDLNLFMKVLVPKADVDGNAANGAEELFAHTSESAWALIGSQDVEISSLEADSEHPVGSYRAYYYCYGTDSALTRAKAGTTVSPLFESVTYTSAAKGTPTANQHIVVDAFAIQADELDSSDPKAIFKLASGEDVPTPPATPTV